MLLVSSQHWQCREFFLEDARLITLKRDDGGLILQLTLLQYARTPTKTNVISGPLLPKPSINPHFTNESVHETADDVF